MITPFKFLHSKFSIGVHVFFFIEFTQRNPMKITSINVHTFFFFIEYNIFYTFFWSNIENRGYLSTCYLVLVHISKAVLLPSMWAWLVLMWENSYNL